MDQVLKDEAANGTGTWELLAEMVDTYGPRMTGSPGLEKSLDWIEQKMREQEGGCKPAVP